MQAVKNLRMNGAVSVPRGYEVEFQRAIWTFRHQRVFDADTGRIMHLRPLPEGGLVAAAGVPDSILEEDPGCGFLGPPLADGIAAAIACGVLEAHFSGQMVQNDTEQGLLQAFCFKPGGHWCR